MPNFLIKAWNAEKGVSGFFYNNETSTLTHEDGTPVDLSHLGVEAAPLAKKTAATVPVGKTSDIRRLKIQMGLSCNYSCEYCSQRFVPHADETSKKDVGSFLAKLPQWFDGGEDGKGQGVRIEFWGGEPFVYWKTFKPLAEGVRARYPNADFLVITNGSLLDLEKNEWLDRLGFAVAISHDGPGQHVRGPDPLADPKQREAILDLFRRLHPSKKISFNSMLNRHNMSRLAVYEFFKGLTGDESVVIGEASLIDTYDEGGMSEALTSDETLRKFANQAFEELVSGAIPIPNLSVVDLKVRNFVYSVADGRHAAALGQKCGMDRPGHVAVDLRGNVLTCQNVSAASVAPNGKSHLIGTVDDLAAAKPVTSRHWSTRENCRNCPVLQLCHGSCMFLEDALWDASCDNAFADNVVFFALAFEMMTGFRPFLIEGGRAERREIWSPKPVSRKKVIPIKAQ